MNELSSSTATSGERFAPEVSLPIRRLTADSGSKSGGASVTVAALRLRWVAACYVMCVLAVLAIAARVFADEERQSAPDHEVAWLHSLERGRELGRTRRAPVLVIAGAVWCGPCKVLDEELKQPVVQNELQRWVPVHLDVDDDPDAASQLAVSSIPALRVLSPDGRLIASHEGVMSAEQLSSWLAEQLAAATDASTVPAGAAGRKLNALAVVNLLKDFRSRESSVREASISRLSNVPEMAASAVVASFADGNLSERLACLELLSLWDAPVAEIDPWIPASVTSERLDGLQSWLDERQFSSPREAGELSAAELLEVRRLLRNMLTADPAAAAAMREQLARMGSATLPLVRKSLAEAATDIERSRLLAAKYRVAATAELSASWPDGIERLASTDYETRVAATVELSRRARRTDETLLLEMFADPVPLIRETSLKTLQRVSGTSANGALVRLLDDPDPNVRAAVLKQLAEVPSPLLVAGIAEYAQKETDPDLVVHAVRFLREVPSLKSVETLIGLFRHPSWRVRAESADGVNRLLERGRPGLSALKPVLTEGFVRLLNDEDGFVVGQAIKGLTSLESSSSVDEMIAVANDRPELASAVVTALGTSFSSHSKTHETLQKFSQHEQPGVRAASITQLINVEREGAADALTDALNDPQAEVRVAAVNAVFRQVAQRIAAKVSAARSSEAASAESSPDSFAGALISGFGRLFAADVPPAEQDSSVEVSDTATNRSDPDTAIRQEHAAYRNREWLHDQEPLIERMLLADNAAEQLAAAKYLTMVGHDQAFEALLRLAESRAHLANAAQVFTGLVWENKVRLYDRLVATAAARSDLVLIAEYLSSSHDLRAASKFWELLAGPMADAHLAAELLVPMVQAYTATNWRSLSEADESRLGPLKEACAHMAAEGSRWQRMAATALLGMVDSALASAAAEPLVHDESLPVEVRADALRVVLFFSDEEPAALQASASLAMADTINPLGEVALLYLGYGSSGIATVGGALRLQNRSSDSYSYSSWDSEQPLPQPIVPSAPEGVTVEQVRPFLASEDAATRAAAACVLTLLREVGHVQTVVDYWLRSTDDKAARRLAWQTIAAANSASHVPVLEQIYQQLKADAYSSDVGEFYWTIRIMTGPDVLALRKQIRSEQSAEALRPKQ